MDLFDFLYEMWKSKWPFLGIVLLFAALGFASYLPRLSSAPAPVTEASTARVEFRLSLPDDPRQRSSSEMISDFLVRLSAVEELNLSNAENAAIGATLTDRTYRVAYSPGSNLGVLTISAPDVEAGYFEQVHTAMQQIAIKQVDDVKQQLARDLAVIVNIRERHNAGDSETISNWLWVASRFLDLPEVKSGNFRFVEVGPLRLDVSRTASSSLVPGLVRRLVIATLLGGVVGVIVVMFRVAIDRRKAGAGAKTTR
ncbi:MAG: hypothetical protein JJ911_09330 [Rhizobiaceae bacterium]|uniref:hypothetical protein n=1 Tax=Parvibaculum sp. TaxID=2024848 RepID=UPI001B26F48C|nr:hypothetical protein [Parvibaculum sp.]MBO6633379.1 hypothetical protein [Parvibaculum sp.]MBO6725848.1 hypothetical protein [Rhizobiaceae bacterium]